MDRFLAESHGTTLNIDGWNNQNGEHLENVTAVDGMGCAYYMGTEHVDTERQTAANVYACIRKYITPHVWAVCTDSPSVVSLSYDVYGLAQYVLLTVRGCVVDAEGARLHP